MKFLILISVVAVAFAADTYNSENHAINPEAITSDVNVMKSFQACFVGTGPCSDAQAHFKKDLGEAIETSCAKCTPEQSGLLKKFIAALKEKLPAEYEEFAKKYDPENKYFAKFGIA